MKRFLFETTIQGDGKKTTMNYAKSLFFTDLFKRIHFKSLQRTCII